MQNIMQRFRFPILLLLALLFLPGCASTPEKQSALQQRANYSEEIITNRQGLHLFARTWQASEPATATIIILHGTALHGGVYESVAKKLNSAGFRVFALDMQGWGRSEGKGAHGYVESFDDYVKDTFEVLNILRMRYPGTPNYVLGENLGGTVAVYGVLKEGLWIDGIITCPIAYKPRPELLGFRAPGFLSTIALTTVTWWGRAAPKAPVMDANVSLRLLFDNDALKKMLLDDPYVAHGLIPAAYVSTLADAMDYTEKNLEAFKLPILLLQGDQDRLVPTSSSQEVFDKVASREKEMRVYHSAHSVLLESSGDQAIQDVISFVNKSVKNNVVTQTEKGVAY